MATQHSRKPAVRSFNVTVPDGPFGDIAGTIDAPAEQTTAAALVAHCFTCDRQAVGTSRISKTLARHGITSARFNFSDLTLSHNVDELVAAAEWMRQEHGLTPQLLVGNSLGGVAAIRAASRLAGITAVATVGTPFDPSHAVASLSEALAPLRESDGPSHVDVPLAGREVRIERSMIEDLMTSDPHADLRALGEMEASLLVAHSPFDQTVAFSDALSFLDAALQPASLLSLPEVDHLLTRRGSGQRMGELIAQWARAYISLD